VTYELLIELPPIEVCASHLGKLGAQARKERTRERYRAVARQMNIDAGRPVPEALL